jgi:hypothetical protein
MDVQSARPSRRARVNHSLRFQSSGVLVRNWVGKAKETLTSKLTIEGQQLRYCGVGAGFDDIIVDGDLEAMKVCSICAIIAPLCY